MASDQPTRFRHSAFRGQLGIERADITPPVGIYSRNWGAAKHDTADSIHRPLTLTALAIAADKDSAQADQRPLVLVDLDLGWWKTPSAFVDFQQQIQAALSLEPARLIFALTHTHAGPPLMQPDPALPGSRLLQTWMSGLVETTIATIRQACSNLFPATLDWHTGQCSLATQRDLPSPEERPSGGPARYLCGYNPAGDPDHTLVVGRITDSQGALRGTLVNYACHPTTLAADNTAISPDYIGAMRYTIEQENSAPAMFLLGMCGDLAPRYQYVGDPDVADQHGRQLAFAALSTLHDMQPPNTSLDYSGILESGAPLAMWKPRPSHSSTQIEAVCKTVDLPLKDWPTAGELEDQRAACTDRALEERLRRRRDIRRGIGDGRSYGIAIHAWRIGDAVLVGSCCEAYSGVQQELRRRFADRSLICMNLINGSIGYLPPDALYDSDVYPVWQTPFERGCLEATLEAMTGAVHDVLND